MCCLASGNAHVCCAFDNHFTMVQRYLVGLAGGICSLTARTAQCLLLCYTACLQLTAEDVHQQLTLEEVRNSRRVDGAVALLEAGAAPVGAVAQPLYAAQQPAEEEPVPAARRARDPGNRSCACSATSKWPIRSAGPGFRAQGQQI